MLQHPCSPKDGDIGTVTRNFHLQESTILHSVQQVFNSIIAVLTVSSAFINLLSFPFLGRVCQYVWLLKWNTISDVSCLLVFLFKFCSSSFARFRKESEYLNSDLTHVFTNRLKQLEFLIVAMITASTKWVTKRSHSCFYYTFLFCAFIILFYFVQILVSLIFLFVRLPCDTSKMYGLITNSTWLPRLKL